MPIELQLDFTFDRILWLCTLNEQEMGPTRRMMEDVESLCSRHNVEFVFYQITTKDEILEVFDIERMKGGSPFIHIDGHGESAVGLRIDPSNECLSFKKLMEKLRQLNINSGNNLVVVSALCYGLQAVLDAGILDPSPYFAYIGPSEVVTVGELESGTYQFYQRLLSEFSLDGSLSALPSMELFHCQELLFGALCRYRRNGTYGKGASLRVEDVLSKAKAQGKILLNEPVGPYRNFIKSRVKTHFTQDFVDGISSRFLIGRPAGFTLDDIEREVRR